MMSSFVLIEGKSRIFLHKYVFFADTTSQRSTWIISEMHTRHTTFMDKMELYLADSTTIEYRLTTCHSRRKCLRVEGFEGCTNVGAV